MPPDSVWTFAFDDGGDEYFYDAIEVSDGYLLCGEWREWNALAGEALLVKIDRDGELVWSRRYPEESARRFTHMSRNSMEVLGEYVDQTSEAYGLFYARILPPDSLVMRGVVGFPDGRQHQSAGISNAFGDTWSFTYSARMSDSTNAVVEEGFSLGSDTTRHIFDFGAFDVCHGYADALTGPTYFGQRNIDRQNSDGFVISRDFNETHQQSFGGADEEHFNAGAPRYADTLLALTGPSYSFSNGGSDLWLMTLNTVTFDSLWSRHYGGLSYEDGVAIAYDEDDGFIIAGNYSSEDIEFEQSDYWLLKVDASGDSVWSVLAGGEEADRCDGMIETGNGYLLFGSSQSFAVPGWDGCAMLLAYVPDLAAAPASLSFGPVAVGDSATRVLNLINTGSNTLTVNEIQGTDAYHANFAGAATVLLGDTLTVDVIFAPASAGTQVDTLRIISDAISGDKIVRCIGAGTAADAGEQSVLPTEFKLYPAYPNPFNATAQIEFDLPTSGQVTLELFDVTGRRMTTLVDEMRTAGNFRVGVDASRWASGIYFAALRAGGDYAVQKMVLLK